MELVEKVSSNGTATGGAVMVEDDGPHQDPGDYEYAGIFDGDMRFLSCTRCGVLVAADAANITRHTESHKQEDLAARRVDVVHHDIDLMAGDDLAQLLRDAVKTEMRTQGVTQVKLSELAGVSQKHLSQMFTGNAVGSLELWSKIASCMNRRWAVSLTDNGE